MTTVSALRRPRVIALFTAWLGALVLVDQPLMAQTVPIFDNGSLATGAYSDSGTAAPAGTHWSELAHQSGSLAANSIIGFTCAVLVGGNFRCADDFNVPAGQTWTVSAVITYQYQTAYAGVASPVTAATMRIWQGRPDDPSSVVLFGDSTTNRLEASFDASLWRVQSTAGGLLPTANRRVWATSIRVAPALVLAAGNYWIDWNTTVGASAQHFAPAVAYTGTRSVPIQNARQFNNITWVDVRDTGSIPMGEPDPGPLAQDFPFKLMGTIAGAPPAPASRSLDFDGDNKTDYAIARSSSAVGATSFWIKFANSSFAGVNWGMGVGFAGGDIPTPADFDGDGKTDLAVWRPGSPGTFWVLRSSNGSMMSQTWGNVGDDPTVVGDYDGDGKADFAIFRPGAGAGQQCQWWILRSLDSAVQAVSWGLTGDKPYPGDYDGDRRMDFAVIRNIGGFAQHFQSRSGGAFVVQNFGVFSDRFATADFDGDGRHDLTAIRNSAGAHLWYVSKSSDGVLASFIWGAAAADFLTPGDFDGDNRTDAAVWRTGLPLNLTNFFTWNSRSPQGIQLWGASAAALTPPDLPLGLSNVR